MSVTDALDKVGASDAWAKVEIFRCVGQGSMRLPSGAMAGLGTAVNVATILAGTGIGLLVGGRVPERARATVLQSVGLVVAVLGIGQALRTENIVFPLVAVVVGGLVGEALRIEDRLESLGDLIRRRVERDVDPEIEGSNATLDTATLDTATLDTPTLDTATLDTGTLDTATLDTGTLDTPTLDTGEVDPAGAPQSTFVEGFVAASLLFCVGPLAILGSISDGLDGDVGLLVVKASLDGLVSIVFAATLGWGVAFSAIPVVVYQGLLTLLAGGADEVLSERMILEGTATGGIMVIGIALRLLDLKAVRVGSLLPALVLAPALVALFGR